jgi:hypothetical protein
MVEVRASRLGLRLLGSPFLKVRSVRGMENKKMKEVSAIKNPLTIIAIFAGIAEISGTAVLPLIDSSLQSTFIWFVMLFPVGLVAVFFATLNLNHAVLYAPSDYRNDDAFLAARSKELAVARTTKLRDELEDVSEDQNPSLTEPTTGGSSAAPMPLSKESLKRTQRGTYFLAEELVLNTLARELKGNFSREAMVAAGRTFHLFDASVSDGGSLTGIEVKYQRDHRVNAQQIASFAKKVNDFYKQMSLVEQKGFLVVLAVATDAPASTHDEIHRRIGRLVQEYEVPIEVRVFDLKELERELDTGST